MDLKLQKWLIWAKVANAWVGMDMIPCSVNFMACELFLFDFVAYEFEVHHPCFAILVGVVIHDCLMLFLLHHCFLLLLFSFDVTIGSPLINLSCYC